MYTYVPVCLLAYLYVCMHVYSSATYTTYTTVRSDGQLYQYYNIDRYFNSRTNGTQQYIMIVLPIGMKNLRVGRDGAGNMY